MLSFFPRDVLDEILNLIESVSEGFPSYSLISPFKNLEVKVSLCLIHNEIPDTEFLKICFISVKANAKLSLLAILET